MNTTDSRGLIKFFDVVTTRIYRRGPYRVVVTPRRGADAETGVTYYLSLRDAEYLLGQLGRAVSRVTKAKKKGTGQQ